MDDIPPPIIQIGPSNQTLPKGSVAMLPCRSIGTPVPQVKWSKDGESLLNRNRFVIVQSGTLKVDGKFVVLINVNILSMVNLIRELFGNHGQMICLCGKDL